MLNLFKQTTMTTKQKAHIVARVLTNLARYVLLAGAKLHFWGMVIKVRSMAPWVACIDQHFKLSYSLSDEDGNSRHVSAFRSTRHQEGYAKSTCKRCRC